MSIDLEQKASFPNTRYMGSKQAILKDIWSAVEDLQFDSVLDAFSGSGCVAHMFKQQGKQVIANDFMKYSYTIAKATIENSHITLLPSDVEFLLSPNPDSGSFVRDTFRGLYFEDAENEFIDNTLANIRRLGNEYKASLARSALARACLKKRPRGVFTYVGSRYDDGRKDLRLSLDGHFRESVMLLNDAVFDNGRRNSSTNLDVFSAAEDTDLVYLDPPYYTPHSDNDYVRRYHFLQGICCDWQGVTILDSTKTKKLKKYPTPFGSKRTIYRAFELLFEKFSNSIILLSYSSNGIPTREDLLGMLKTTKASVRVIEIDHRYSFGTYGHKIGNRKNTVQEYLFVAQ